MAQKLINSINNAKLNASWKTDAYKSSFGMVHYGIDMVSTAGVAKLYACGKGVVIATGNDSVLGNFLVIQYKEAYNNKTKAISDLIVRTWHMASVSVKKGENVTKDTPLGTYGNTGQYTTGAHLHLEVDTDIVNPMYTPSLTGKTANFFGTNYGANDKTMSNPLEWIHCKVDAPDNQTWTTANDKYIREEDKNIVTITAATMDVTNPLKIEGIDVSVHNGAVDWAKVKTAKDFVFVRLGWAGWDGAIEKNGGLDKNFHANVKAAIAVGLNVGVYVYSYCKTPEAATIAAREVLQLVKPYKLTYPIAFDIEDTSDAGTRYDKMTKAQNNAICAAFLDTVNDANYYGILYTYTSFANSYLDMSNMQKYDLWLAQYATAPTYKGEFGIWQYKGDVTNFIGSCLGVTGACDLNVSYRDYAKLITTAGLNIYEETPVVTDPHEAVILQLEEEIIRLQKAKASVEEYNDQLRQEKEKLQADSIRLNARISELDGVLKQIATLAKA